MDDYINKMSADIANSCPCHHELTSRDRNELKTIINNIFVRNDRIEILVDLANRLPGMTIERLLLCGLTDMLTLTKEEYEKMFELANTRGVAFYHLTHFLKVHGGAQRQMFSSLGADMAQLDKIGDIRVLSFIGESEEGAA